jgi:outer membrane usher protein
MRDGRGFGLKPGRILLSFIVLMLVAYANAQDMTPVPERLLPFEVIINGSSGGNWVLLELNGILHAPSDAFDEWRLVRARDAKAVQYRGQTWYPLSSIPVFEERRNLVNQSVDLVFSPTAFAATRLSSENALRPPLTVSVPAFFLNYDLSATQAMPKFGPVTRDAGALTELGFTSGIGVLTSSAIGRNFMSRDVTAPSNWRRLETSFTRDFPEKNVTLRLGDTTTRSSLSGRSVYFGGLQVAKNFALTPGFITQPIPTIAGVSSAPSTLSLYVNDALRQVSNVPAGPFAIENFPLLSGAGEARVVVRDLLGRETVVTQRFFTDPNLLDKGLADWSFEAGALRRNLGIENADYGERFASGVMRYGISPVLTLETQGQLSKTLQGSGIGASFGLPFQTLGQLSLAYSRDKNGDQGHEWLIGMQNNNVRHGFSMRAQSASRDYRQLGLDKNVPPQKLALSATYLYASQNSGSIGLGLARIASYDRNPFTTYSANYSIGIGKRSSLTLNGTRVTGSTSGTSFGVALIIPLDRQVISSSGVSVKSGEAQAYSTVSKGLTTEIGAGWRASAGRRAGEAYSEGGVYYQGSKALLTGDVSVAPSQNTVRVGAQGGLVIMDGKFFTSRRIEESFALVEVPGYADVAIGFQGSSLTRTDNTGSALLPRLLPYQANNIQLNPTELPISAELDTIEQIAVPAARSAVKVLFPVRSGRGALIKIVMEDGDLAPAGARVQLVGDDKKEFFVARRGETFVTGLQAVSQLRLKWSGKSCSLKIELPPGTPDDIARVGPVTCMPDDR